MPDFVTLIGLILAGLRQGIGVGVARHRAAEPLLARAWSYVGRTAQRFQRLHARWQAGLLAPPHHVAAGHAPAPRSATSGKPRPTNPRLPQGQAWLLRYNNDMGNFGSQIRALATQPDMAEFLAAVPRAGRLLRPLLHMLGTDLTATPLAKPSAVPRPQPAQRQPAQRQPAQPQPATPPTPAEPLRWGKYPNFNPRTYRPGRIPPAPKITPA